jgi:hypothetical protein
VVHQQLPTLLRRAPAVPSERASTAPSRQHTRDGICHQHLPQPRRCNRASGCRRSRCEHAVQMAAKQGRLGRSGAGGKRGCCLLNKALHGVICKSHRKG